MPYLLCARRAMAQENQGVSLAVAEDGGAGDDSLLIRSLSFAFPGHAPMLSDISLRLPRGARCLLCGANGGGAFPPRAFCVAARPSTPARRAHSRTAATLRVRGPLQQCSARLRALTRVRLARPPQARARCCRSLAARQW